MIDFTLLGASQVALLVGAASLITFALYFLKPRKRRVLVPFVGLWESVLTPKPSAALFARLRQLLSLLIALLVVALLGLARGGPAWGVRAGKHSIVLVDAGLHMQAHDVKPTRWAMALAEAHKLIDARGPADDSLLAQLDDVVTPVTPMTSDARVLSAALTELRPSTTGTSLSAGLSFALDVLRERAHPEVILISDGIAEPDASLVNLCRKAGIALRQLRIGQGSANLRVSALSARRYPIDPSEAEIMVEVENGGPIAAHATLTLLSDGRALEVEALALPAHAKLTRFYEHVAGADATLQARITPAGDTHDDLAADDQRSAVLPARPRKRVLAVTDGNRYLEAALLLDELLDVHRVSPARYTNADGYDAVIFDGFVPASPPNAPGLYLAPSTPSDSFPFVVRGVVARPFIDTLMQSHPLVRFAALRDVNIARALLLVPQPGDQVVAASGKTPLLITGQRNSQRIVALAFDVRESDLPLRTAWPLLLLRSLEVLTSNDADLLASKVVGRSEAYGSASIAPRTILPLAGTPAAIGLPLAAARDPWFLLLALAAAIVVLEWLSFQRRWTV